MESLGCLIFLKREIALAVSNLRIICRKCVQELLTEAACQRRIKRLRPLQCRDMIVSYEYKREWNRSYNCLFV